MAWGKNGTEEILREAAVSVMFHQHHESRRISLPSCSPSADATRMVHLANET